MLLGPVDTFDFELMCEVAHASETERTRDDYSFSTHLAPPTLTTFGQ